MRVYIIAEIGINHNGNLKLAKKMILNAKVAGFDAVKFQKRTIELVYSEKELSSERTSPWGTTFYQQKKGLEFEKKEYDAINSYCKEINIDWSCSAWDLESFHFIQQYDLKFHKVASPMISNIDLLKLIAKDKKKTFISTGMSSMDEIKSAVNIFKDNNCDFELMHCISKYPFENELANLCTINTLKRKFQCNVGYSGHEKAGQLISWAAVAIGATSLERHITEDRSIYGSDQAASLEPDGYEKLIKGIRTLEKALGDGKKNGILGIEKESALKLKYKKIR